MFGIIYKFGLFYAYIHLPWTHTYKEKPYGCYYPLSYCAIHYSVQDEIFNTDFEIRLLFANMIKIGFYLLNAVQEITIYTCLYTYIFQILDQHYSFAKMVPILQCPII